ncbi:MAG: hypothetical protein WCF84_18110 [Anaerolineae bacterium]
MFLADFHCRIALSSLFYAFALGAWGTVGFLMARGVSGNYFGALAIGELLMLVQGALGVILVLTGNWPADWVHLLYGVLAVSVWPFVYVSTQAAVSRREMGYYALASFFIFGLAVRAIMTGPGADGASCLPH